MSKEKVLHDLNVCKKCFNDITWGTPACLDIAIKVLSALPEEEYEKLLVESEEE